MREGKHSASAYLIATLTTGSYGIDNLILEGDAIYIILDIQNLGLFLDSNFVNVIANISLILVAFQDRKALNVFRCANFLAYFLGR
jgi:hypothetical protein